MRVGSLFAGIGGFDLAARWMGWRTCWYSEIEPWACRVMAHHFPDAPNLGDVTTVDWRTVERPDLLVGGFPCQPASQAGRRQGTADARWLWPECARALRELRPRWAVFENVPGLLSVNGGRAFGAVLGDLAALGYDAGWHCISAASVGAPHRRERIWIVAHAQGRTERTGLRAEESGREWRGRHGHGGGELGHAEQPGLEGLAGDGNRGCEPGRLASGAGRPVGATGAPVHPWADWVPVRGADGTVRLIPREAVADTGRTGVRFAQAGGGDGTGTPADGRGKGVCQLADTDGLRAGAGTRGNQGEPQSLGDGGSPPSHGAAGGVQPALWAGADGVPGDMAGRSSVRGPEAWPTPQAEDASGSGSAATRDERQAMLHDSARKWATPRAEDAECAGRRHGRGVSDTLHAQANDFAAASQGWRTVWPVVSGMPNRAAGCRLVGNSIVPQAALAVFLAIASLEER